MTIAYTICSANYLPFAKSLADSLIKYNPDYLFIIALADTYNNYDHHFFTPHVVVPVSKMDISFMEEMKSRYTIFELSCALKPPVALYILKNYVDCNSIFYFDSDIMVFIQQFNYMCKLLKTGFATIDCAQKSLRARKSFVVLNNTYFYWFQ